MDYNPIFVCLMGMGTVFFGLICLILLTSLMGRIVGRGAQTPPVLAPASIPMPAANTAEPDRQAIAAAVAAAIAEELGTDVTGIRILSMKKL